MTQTRQLQRWPAAALPQDFAYRARVEQLADVRFGSGTDILRTSTDVRLAPESGHRPELAFGCQKHTHAPQELAAHFAGTASFAENKTLVINRSEVHLVSDELGLRSPLRVRSGGSRLQTEFVAIS